MFMISNKNEQWDKVRAIAACELTCYKVLRMLCKGRRYRTSTRVGRRNRFEYVTRGSVFF